MSVKLLKVVVQPHFVLLDEDGEIESELIADPVTVAPKDWPTYAQTTFVEAMDSLVAERDGAQRAGG
jgi:hypothetical protein